MAESDDWASDFVKEVPFWRNGMSFEEYEKEHDYWWQHIKEWAEGAYEPLWKQAERRYK